MIVSKKLFPLLSGIVIALSAAAAWGAESGSGAAAGGTGVAGMSQVLSNYSYQSAMQLSTPVSKAVNAGASDGRGEALLVAPERDARMDATQNPDRVNAKDDVLPKSEFQTFVMQSLGRDLPMFGYDLFRRAPSTFAPVDHIPVTPDYTIGPGDELLVHVWGQVGGNLSLVVDRNGQITLPNVGTISVAGVTYQNLQAHLKAAVGKMFRNFELDVALGKLRSIQVFVVGQAARPGNYTVSSLSTLVNTLFASGGPSSKGSMRHIQLRRADKVVVEFDMYDLLLKGDKSKDVQLLPGDVIYIPTVGAMVAISGSVSTSSIFELKGKESLSDLLELAGGLTNVAAGQKVTVERIFERATRKVEEFVLDSDGLAKAMRDGDLVTVGSISAKFSNAITLRGNIATAGRKPWKPGLRVSDVIPDKGVLILDSYWLKQNQAGRMDQAGRTDFVVTDKFRNEIKHSLAEVNWDYAVIERLNPKDLTTSLIPFNLAKAVIDRDPVQNLVLQAGDVVTIFSKDDIQVSTAKRTKYVVLEGELANPGIYQAEPGETLRQLVARVGGLSAQSYLFSSEFTREATRQMQQKRLTEMVDRMEEAVQRTSGKVAVSALSAQDLEATRAQAQSQQALIAKMRQVKATGRIVLEMSETDNQVNALPDLALEDGDRLFVPSVSSTVNVMGLVYNQNAFLYRSGQTVSDYLGKAGGPTRDGDEDEIYLIRADGLVYSKRQGGSLFSGFGGRQAMPGDTIVVSEKLERFNFTKELKDWTQIIYQFALAAAGGKAAKMW